MPVALVQIQAKQIHDIFWYPINWSHILATGANNIADGGTTADGILATTRGLGGTSSSDGEVEASTTPASLPATTKAEDGTDFTHHTIGGISVINDGVNIGAVVGAVAGVAVLVLITVIIVIVVLIRWKSQKQHEIPRSVHRPNGDLLKDSETPQRHTELLPFEYEVWRVNTMVLLQSRGGLPTVFSYLIGHRWLVCAPGFIQVLSAITAILTLQEGCYNCIGVVCYDNYACVIYLYILIQSKWVDIN